MSPCVLCCLNTHWNAFLRLKTFIRLNVRNQLLNVFVVHINYWFILLRAVRGKGMALKKCLVKFGSNITKSTGKNWAMKQREEYPSTVYFHKNSTAACSDKMTLHVNTRAEKRSKREHSHLWLCVCQREEECCFLLFDPYQLMWTRSPWNNVKQEIYCLT